MPSIDVKLIQLKNTIVHYDFSTGIFTLEQELGIDILVGSILAVGTMHYIVMDSKHIKVMNVLPGSELIDV